MKNQGTKCTFILVVVRPTVVQSSFHTEFLSSIRFSLLRILQRRKRTRNFLAFSSGQDDDDNDDNNNNNNDLLTVPAGGLFPVKSVTKSNYITLITMAYDNRRFCPQHWYYAQLYTSLISRYFLKPCLKTVKKPERNFFKWNKHAGQQADPVRAKANLVNNKS